MMILINQDMTTTDSDDSYGTGVDNTDEDDDVDEMTLMTMRWIKE